MPKISVIVPVYNVEKYIDRCIKSILAQSFTDFELLLIDDGSKDRSGEICDYYAERNEKIRVFHNDNHGVSFSRNFGLNTSAGEYIAFVDSDDCVEEDYLKVLFKGIGDSDLSICGVFFCDNQKTRDNPQKNTGNFILSFNSVNNRQLSDLIVNRRFNYVYAKLFKASIIKGNKLLFNKSVDLGEDTIFVMEYILYAKSINIIGDAYYYYIKDNVNSLTGRFYADIYQRYNIINDKMEEIFAKMGLMEKVKDALIYRRLKSGEWALNSIFAQKHLSNKEIVILTDKVLNDKTYIDSYVHYMEKGNPYISNAIKPQKAIKYIKTIKKEKRILKIKTWILKKTPVFIKKMFKKGGFNVL